MKTKKKRKKVLLIVQGFWPVKFKNKFVERIRNLIVRKAAIFNSDYDHLAEYFRKDYDIIEIFRWQSRLTKKELIKATDEFEKMLRKYKGEYIDLISVSMGGKISQNVLARNKNIKIHQILYIGAIHHGNHEFENVKSAINVYSPVDKVFFYVNDIYEGLGNAFLQGKNVINIALNGIAHDKWCRNVPLNEKFLKHKHLYDLYRDLLLSN